MPCREATRNRSVGVDAPCLSVSSALRSSESSLITSTPAWRNDRMRAPFRLNFAMLA
jgi:hypothetical protein